MNKRREAGAVSSVLYVYFLAVMIPTTLQQSELHGKITSFDMASSAGNNQSIDTSQMMSVAEIVQRINLQ
jgi:hypothetical protein